MTARTLIPVLAAACVAGCGGGLAHVFTVPDAARIANVAPAAPGWTWPREPLAPVPADASDAADPLLTELKQSTADLDFLGEEGNRWRDEDKLANLVVQVYATAADAEDALEPFNAFSRAWGKKSGEVTKDETLDELADGGWRLWVGGSGTQVTYHWRRRNLVLEAHVHCFGVCPSDVDGATRRWVDAVDAAADA